MLAGNTPFETYHFPDELLQHIPPDHNAERRAIMVQIITTIFFCLVVAPRIVASFFTMTPEQDNNGKQTVLSSSSEGIKIVCKENENERKRTSKRIKRSKKQKQSEVKDEGGLNSSRQPRSQVPKKIDPPFLPLATVTVIGLCVVIPYLILRSPNNSYSARGIFRAPLFTPEECQEVIKMAERAAERNYIYAKDLVESSLTGVDLGPRDTGTSRSIISEPRGWRKDRHGSYPTTDLNVVTDPFTDEDRNYLEEKFDSRLAPLIERVFGIDRGSIRANDVFVVRYDARGGKGWGQKSLRRHTDSADVSFNVLLNGDFEGGGTRFHDHRDLEGDIDYLAGQNKYFDVRPEPGDVLIHHSVLMHEGLPITSGTRYILVGFLSVDVIDPFTNRRTALSPFASYLNVQWLHVKFKDGYNAAHNRLDTRFAMEEIEVMQEEDVAETTTAADGNIIINVVHDDDAREDPLEQRTTIQTFDHRWTDHKYVRMLLYDLVRAMTLIGDGWAPIFHKVLVDVELRTQYLVALDEAAALAVSKEVSSWFKGQNIILDVDGGIAGRYGTSDMVE